MYTNTLKNPTSELFDFILRLVACLLFNEMQHKKYSQDIQYQLNMSKSSAIVSYSHPIRVFYSNKYNLNRFIGYFAHVLLE